MKILKQRIAKAFGGGTSERGTSNLEIVVWMSVVLVIAVGMFLLRDNIAKFINNAATQIAGEASNDEINEYGFYFNKMYANDYYGFGYVFHEDGSVEIIDGGGNVLESAPSGCFSYSNGVAINNLGGPSINFEPSGKTAVDPNNEITYTLKE